MKTRSEAWHATSPSATGIGPGETWTRIDLLPGGGRRPGLLAVAVVEHRGQVYRNLDL